MGVEVRASRWSEPASPGPRNTMSHIGKACKAVTPPSAVQSPPTDRMRLSGHAAKSLPPQPAAVVAAL